MSVVQAQWNLDQSSHSVIGIARGVLQAATTDNVQVLAILACERFGATLAISPETCIKIEREMIPTPEHAVVNFLKITVGYNPNDCVVQLGKSLAGVQYLALAAALVGTMDPFKAASAIQEMLVDTALDKTLVPTVRQVQDLLNSIAPRCLRTGFANSVSGYHTLLLASKHEYVNYAILSRFPGRQGLVALVDAFRQLRRVGDEHIVGLTIQVLPHGSAWTIAFVKWCLGIPPLVMFNDGTSFLVQDGSDVTVVISDPSEPGSDFEVVIHSSINGPSELVRSSLDNYVAGMIDIPFFGKEMLQQHGFDDDLPRRALQQALPFGLGQALKLLFLAHPDESDQPLSHRPFHEQEAEEPLSTSQRLLMESRVSPFPEEPTIRRMLSLLFGFSPLKCRPLDDGLSISDLPVVALYLKQIEQECSCVDCKPGSRKPGCLLEVFWNSLSTIIAAVLSLSLFQTPEFLRVWSGNLTTGYNRFNHAFINAIYLILTKGVYVRCPVHVLMFWTLRHVGHVRAEGTQCPLLSCFKGQAVWPVVYEDYTLARRGYLTVAWLPGLIYHKNEAYELVNFSQRGEFDDITTAKLDEPVTSPRNLFPKDLHLQWSVAPCERGVLEAELGVNTLRLQIFSAFASRFFYTMCNVFSTKACGHPPDDAIPKADKFAKFTTPMCGLRIDSSKIHVSVVAVDGNDEHRFLALTTLISMFGNKHPQAVLRNGACLRCSLDFCRRFEINVLIL